MERSEAVELIMYTGEKWGAAAAVPADPTRLGVRVQVWMDHLADFPAADVRAALVASEDEFPPNVMVLRRRALDARGLGPDLPAWDEFVAWVRKEGGKASLYLYDDAPPFECPWPELAGVVTLEVVLQWARDGLTSATFEQVLVAHIRRTYEAVVKRVSAGVAVDPPALAAWKGELARSSSDLIALSREAAVRPE